MSTKTCVTGNNVILHKALAARGGGAYLLLVVGDDAADEVGAGVVEGLHEAVQLLLVGLGHGAEHPLPGARPEGRLSPTRHAHAHDLRCQGEQGLSNTGWENKGLVNAGWGTIMSSHSYVRHQVFTIPSHYQWTNILKILQFLVYEIAYFYSYMYVIFTNGLFSAAYHTRNKTSNYYIQLYTTMF